MERRHEPADQEMPLSLPDTQTQTQTQSDDTLTQSQPSQNILSPWGKLEVCRGNFEPLRLVNVRYSAGRNYDCDIVFSQETLGLKEPKELCVFSKRHFVITRQPVGDKDDFVALLRDESHNGTFINKRLVGKGKQAVLENDDLIAIGRAQFNGHSVFAAVFRITGLPVGITSQLPDDLKPRYTVLRKLGAGAAGEVHLVFCKGTFSPFAMKIIAKKGMTLPGVRNPLNDPRKIRNEVNILRKLKHPCIIKMEDLIDKPDKVYIILELANGGELFDRIRDNGGLPEKVTKFMFYQICLAVSYLHGNGITHRDLKPENILLLSDDEYPLVKVSDFGMSKFVDAESMMKTFCGTPLYVAPEILKTSGRGAYTSQVDVWSLGVILYVMLSGLSPFSTSHQTMDLQEQILHGTYRFPAVKFGIVTLDAKDLIKSMLTVNPAKRSTIQRVLSHRWINDDAKIRRSVNELLYGPAANENTAPNVTVQRVRNEEHCFEVPEPKLKRARAE